MLIFDYNIASLREMCINKVGCKQKVKIWVIGSAVSIAFQKCVECND